MEEKRTRKRITIDSRGRQVEIPEGRKAVMSVPQDIRLKELEGFRKDFLYLLKQRNIETEDKVFCYMAQPYYTNERILFSTKTEFSSSSKAVKLANEIEKHPEILASAENTNFLRSIIPSGDSGQAKWYLLSIGAVEFERNFYDGKRIRASFVQPVPYYSFMKDIRSQLVTIDDDDARKPCPRYRIIGGADIRNEKALLEGAFLRDIDGKGYSLFDGRVENATEQYERTVYAGRDKNSNRAYSCLTAINADINGTYDVYSHAKVLIKKAYRNAYNIQYHGNKISAVMEDGSGFEAYIIQSGNQPKFIIGGFIIDGYEGFKKSLSDKTYTKEAKWFAEKVKPNIRQRGKRPERRPSQRDELGWNDKPKIYNKKGD